MSGEIRVMSEERFLQLLTPLALDGVSLSMETPLSEWDSLQVLFASALLAEVDCYFDDVSDSEIQALVSVRDLYRLYIRERSKIGE